jgi:hypothetical protein
MSCGAGAYEPKVGDKRRRESSSHDSSSRDESSDADGGISDNDSLSGHFRHVRRRAGTTRRGKAVSIEVLTEARGKLNL